MIRSPFLRRALTCGTAIALAGCQAQGDRPADSDQPADDQLVATTPATAPGLAGTWLQTGDEAGFLAIGANRVLVNLAGTRPRAADVGGITGDDLFESRRFALEDGSELFVAAAEEHDGEVVAVVATLVDGDGTVHPGERLYRRGHSPRPSAPTPTAAGIATLGGEWALVRIGDPAPGPRPPATNNDGPVLSQAPVDAMDGRPTAPAPASAPPRPPESPRSVAGPAGPTPVDQPLVAQSQPPRHPAPRPGSLEAAVAGPLPAWQHLAAQLDAAGSSAVIARAQADQRGATRRRFLDLLALARANPAAKPGILGQADRLLAEQARFDALVATWQGLQQRPLADYQPALATTSMADQRRAYVELLASARAEPTRRHEFLARADALAATWNASRPAAPDGVIDHLVARLERGESQANRAASDLANRQRHDILVLLEEAAHASADERGRHLAAVDRAWADLDRLNRARARARNGH